MRRALIALAAVAWLAAFAAVVAKCLWLVALLKGGL
jgi:hypothetical protein